MKCIKILHNGQTYADQSIILQNFPDLKYKMTSKFWFSEIFQIYADSRMGTLAISKYHRTYEDMNYQKNQSKLMFRTTIYVQVAMQKNFHTLQPLKTSNKLNEKFVPKETNQTVLTARKRL